MSMTILHVSPVALGPVIFSTLTTLPLNGFLGLKVLSGRSPSSSSSGTCGMEAQVELTHKSHPGAQKAHPPSLTWKVPNAWGTRSGHQWRTFCRVTSSVAVACAHAACRCMRFACS